MSQTEGNEEPQATPAPPTEAAPAEAKPAPKKRGGKSKEVVIEDIEPVVHPAIYAVKTSIGHEKTVADGIAVKAKREKVEVYSILSPAPMRGYVYLEGVNPDRLTDLIKGVKRARGMVRARGSEDPADSAIP